MFSMGVRINIKLLLWAMFGFCLCYIYEVYVYRPKLLKGVKATWRNCYGFCADVPKKGVK